ncbi:hypothetical protein BDV96DRAFT_585345 [Lophiotrema nucula]|uniref:Uncharacterized protein n=1 Tax=Lophiotrema nucula TaxID=690887 RepID=A0A6A5YTE3_9PLEO|nr:hypothetical protein BDV96DRAFT_585345 [Lophiotrema nucula]
MNSLLAMCPHLEDLGLYFSRLAEVTSSDHPLQPEVEYPLDALLNSVASFPELQRLDLYNAMNQSWYSWRWQPESERSVQLSRVANLVQSKMKHFCEKDDKHYNLTRIGLLLHSTKIYPSEFEDQKTVPGMMWFCKSSTSGDMEEEKAVLH